MTEHKDAHGQSCCGRSLTVLEDYVGGGSHYWTLRCEHCQKRYTFDTFRFQLEEWVSEAKQVVDQITEAVDQSNLCVVLRGGDKALEALLVADEQGRWSIPGGHAKGNESHKEAAQREVQEETGLAVDPQPLLWAKHVARGPGREVNLFYAVIHGGDDARPGGGDVTEVRWTPVSKLGDLNGTDRLAIQVAANRVHAPQDLVDEEVGLGESLGYAVGNVMAPPPVVDGIYLRIAGIADEDYVKRVASWAEGLGWPVKRVSSKLFQSTLEALSRAAKNRRLTPVLEAIIRASDSIWRYESVIGPALAEGFIVIETGPTIDIQTLQNRGIHPEILEAIMGRVLLPTVFFGVPDTMNLQILQTIKDSIESLKRPQLESN